MSTEDPKPVEEQAAAMNLISELLVLANQTGVKVDMTAAKIADDHGAAVPAEEESVEG